MSATSATKSRWYAKSTSASVSASDLIGGVNDGTYEENTALLESTDFKNLATDVWKRRIAGLFDGKIDISGDYDQSNAPQALLRWRSLQRMRTRR